MLQFNDKFSNSQLASLRIHDEENMVNLKATQLGLDYINLRDYTIHPEALAVFKEKDARDAELAGFEINRNNLSIGIKNPTSPKTQALLQWAEQRRMSIHVYLCSEASLEHAWSRYKDITDSSAEKKGVFEISAKDIARLSGAIKRKEDVREILKTISTISNVRRISETLELIFAGGLALGASDIHIEPEKLAVRLRYRFDGVLHDVADLDSYIFSRLMSRLKLLSGMTLNTKAEAQDGRFSFDTSEKVIEVRSSVIPGAIGESIVMRLLDPTVASFSMDKIQLNPYLEKEMILQLKRPNGLIITTGPTGSGKTTALYAFLRETHHEGVKIITIENPVEYKLDGIVQTQVSQDYTFASGLRAILRQDPDIIMVGEIRDSEVAETAIHAAQTGHLVFSTLHTNSAVAGFVRLIDLGIDLRIVVNAINIIIGQRLIRLLCEKCKQAYSPDLEEAELVKNVMAEHPHPTPLSDPLTLFKAVGCEHCGGTGFKGRVGIFEGVVVDEAVEEVVIRDPREHIILEAAKPQGIPTMIQDGIEKVVKGQTSIRELERVIELPHYKKGVALTAPTSKTIVSEDDFSAHIV